MSTLLSHLFDDSRLLPALMGMPEDDLDLLDFGLIGFDAEGVVLLYNDYESKCAGLSPDRVKGYSLFTVVAPCMNNFLVAQRFEDAAEAKQPLDVTIDYVLTLRMRPVKVKLRLLAHPASALRYVLVLRRI